MVKTLIIDFTKQILPTIDKTFPFHLDNLDLILSIIGFQNPSLLGFPPIGSLKYLKGKLIILQFGHFANTFRCSILTLTIPT